MRLSRCYDGIKGSVDSFCRGRTEYPNSHSVIHFFQCLDADENNKGDGTDWFRPPFALNDGWFLHRQQLQLSRAVAHILDRDAQFIE